VQNDARAEDVGTASSANDLFREIGATVGTAAVGALFTHRLIAQLGIASRSASGTRAATSTRSRRLSSTDYPEKPQNAVVLAYQHARTPSSVPPAGHRAWG
jgi:hypothetical protein